MEKIDKYLGLCKKAGYLIIGADRLGEYHKKLYLLVVYGEITNTILKVIKNKTAENANIKCITTNKAFSHAIGIDNCKIIGIKNKGITEQILKIENEYSFFSY